MLLRPLGAQRGLLPTRHPAVGSAAHYCNTKYTSAHDSAPEKVAIPRYSLHVAVGGHTTAAAQAWKPFSALHACQKALAISPVEARSLADMESGEEAPAAQQQDGLDAATAAAALPVVVPELDRESFKQVLDVVALRVPVKKCSEMMKAFRGYTLDRPRLRCIASAPPMAPAAAVAPATGAVPATDGEGAAGAPAEQQAAAGSGSGASAGRPEAVCKETKLLLLEEGVAIEGLPAELRERVSKDALEVLRHQVVLEYGALNAETVLKRLLPPGVDAPASFETIGHIAHLNLRDEQLPYRHLIGQVLLDKNPHLKTIVNKLGSIENEYRVFSMEVIAGEPKLETEVTQHGARFRLDFSQVYWNSRLEAEHLRLVNTHMERGQVLVDMMAGIGPFAVPAAHKGLEVYANDLNPRSAYYMATNVRINRLTGAVRVFNMDGRAFLRMLCDTPGTDGGQLAEQLRQAAEQQKEQQQQQQQQAGDGAAAAAPSSSPPSAKPPAPKRQRTQREGSADTTAPPPPTPPGFAPPAGGLLFDHVVMNLPASAIEFLDAFNGAFSPDTWQNRQLPMVHCYTFKRGTESEADIVARAEHYLGGAMEPGSCSVHTVRDVAPNKLMLCLSFRVPQKVAFNGRA